MQVTEEAKHNFYKSFNKNEKTVLEDIEIIKEWLKTQKHLPEIMGDNHIRNFLHLNKFSIENAKVKIDMYYTMRSVVPDLFGNPNSEKITKNLENLLFGLWPTPHEEIDKLIFMQCGSPIHFNDWSGLYLSAFEIRLNEDFMGRDVAVVDWQNVKINDLSEFSVSSFSKLFTAYQKVYSMRIKRFYYINAPSFVNKVVGILKIVLKPKIFDRVEVCSDTDILTELMPKEELPKDYGGNGPSLKELSDKTKEKMREYKERFDYLENLKIDESLRPEKLNNDELLGFHGNFKKIDVD